MPLVGFSEYARINATLTITHDSFSRLPTILERTVGQAVSVARTGYESMAFQSIQTTIQRSTPVVAEMDRNIGRLIDRCIGEAVAFDVARTSFTTAIMAYAQERNPEDLKAWARAQGFETAGDATWARHALVAYAQARMARAIRTIMS